MSSTTVTTGASISVDRSNEQCSSEVIAGSIARLEALLGSRPNFGRTTNSSTTTSSDDLRCSSEEGTWNHITDLGAALGGGESAPTPGVLARAALGSCLAMGYRLRAAMHGVELNSIRITVETDSDLRGLLCLDADVPAGFTEVRYHVEIETSASVAALQRVIDEGDRQSPLLDAFARANTIRRTVSIGTVGH